MIVHRGRPWCFQTMSTKSCASSCLVARLRSGEEVARRRNNRVDHAAFRKSQADNSHLLGCMLLCRCYHPCCNDATCVRKTWIVHRVFTFYEGVNPTPL